MRPELRVDAYVLVVVRMHSALDAVGLTAAVSTALASHGISCNLLARYFHDHLLAAIDRADEARRVLEQLSALAARGGGSLIDIQPANGGPRDA